MSTARSAGFLLPRVERSVWVHGRSPAAYDRAGGLIHDMQEQSRRARWVFTVREREAEAWLQRRYVDDVVCSVPRSAGGLLRFFRSLNPERLVVLGSAEGLSPRTFALVRARGLHVLWAGVSEDGLREIAALLRAAHLDVEHTRFWAATAVVRDGLLALGVPADAVAASPDVATAPAADARHTLLKPTLRDRVGQSRVWRGLAEHWAAGRIDDGDRLRARLGHPETILCLGNGPSSEDPAVLACRYDALFRVNHVWQERGVLSDPDVVFVGTPDTMRRVRGCLYGFSTRRKEAAMLLRRLWTCGPGPLEYVTVERLCALADEGRWPVPLTTGAYMVLAAAALRPRRLVVAGLDLYAHPDGRYSGDRHAHNGYAPDHDRDTEVEAIAAALRAFPNERIVIGDVLRGALAARGLS
jgi:hypothetical protein